MRLIHRCLLLSLLVSPLACEVGEAGEVPYVAGPSVLGTVELAATALKNLQLYANASGKHATFSTGGKTQLTHAFFKPIGTNGRACATCHEPANGWSLTPAHIEKRFDATGGSDPLFRPVDTSNHPAAAVSTVDARRAAYSLFRTRGVVRFTFAPPPGAEFQLLFSDDPYGNDANLGITVFRRPPAATGMKFLKAVMWDGRGLRPDDLATGGLTGALKEQANDAHLLHAQAAAGLSDSAKTAIAALEVGNFTAQETDAAVGSLTAAKGRGGAKELSAEAGAAGPFTLYDAWSATGKKKAAARAAVRRGQDLFNTLPITITGVRGLNSDAVPVVNGTCGTCHDAANVGSQSTFSTFDIGVSAASRRPADLPLHTLVNTTTGESVSLTDPGRALVTGLWSDFGRFKSPSLRGLASRPPYFHDGTAATIEAVIDFYDGRFQMAMTPEDKADMAAFLRAL